MNKENISTLHLPVSLRYLPAIQAYISELAKNVKFSKKDITLFNIAVEEAITNVVKHAFLPETEQYFDIECQINPIEFKVIIRDKGLPFDPTQVKEFSAKKSLDGVEQVGLGFKLMKGSVDKLSFHNLGFGGKEVHLVKYIDQKHIDKYFKASQMEAYEKPQFVKKTQRIKIPYHIMLLDPKQAIEISQCAYKAYGYTYFMENIYYPERIIEMNKMGELISAVAVSDENNEVMSHCSLEFFGRKKSIPELGMAFTKPRFRGQGCMNNLNEFLIQQAKNKKVKGIYADGVTIHPYSQKALIKGGFKSCGIRIGMDPPRAFKGIDDKCAQRESMVLFYNKIVDQYAEVYAPVHHKSIIEEIYNNIGIEAKVNSPPSLEEDKSKLVQSDIEVDIRKSIDIASFYINTIGTNFKDEIKLRLRELCMKKIEVIDLHLDMCKKNLVRSVPDLEMLGFFFAGVLPNDRQQFLLLQYLNNLPIDYNKIVCYSEFAKKLKKYVQVCDPNSK